LSATLDSNILVYASDDESPFQLKALALLEDLAAGPDLLYVFWPALFGYLRMTTHSAIFLSPLSPAAALANVGKLLGRPHVRSPGEDEGFWGLYQLVASEVVVRGNLVSDAHLVTLMRQHGVETIWTHDKDFKKFSNITVRDPF